MAFFFLSLPVSAAEELYLSIFTQEAKHMQRVFLYGKAIDRDCDSKPSQNIEVL